MPEVTQLVRKRWRRIVKSCPWILGSTLLAIKLLRGKKAAVPQIGRIQRGRYVDQPP